MIDSLKPASAAALPCKICGGATALYGVVDFNKSYGEANGIRLPLSGVPIYYRRCANCEFLFPDAFDGWSDEQFKAHIYNDGYGAVDPDYETVRPRSNADVVKQLWGPHKAQTRVLDYGGGNDAFCAALRADGFPVAVSYDPMVPAHARRPEGKFEVVTCFETLEHLPDPVGGIALLAECVAEPGLAHISTCAARRFPHHRRQLVVRRAAQRPHLDLQQESADPSAGTATRPFPFPITFISHFARCRR
jgi:hypothetical protein